MECLSDPAKRELYDQCGGTNENEQYSRAASQGGGGGGRGFNGRHPAEMSPEELFNMFFQGAARGGGAHMGGAHMGGPGFRMHFGGMPQGRQRDEQANGGSFQQLMGFLPIILLFLMSFSPFGNNNYASNERVFTFSQSGAYSVPRETSMNGVVKDIPYFVTPKFRNKYGKSYSDLYKVEKAVEREFRDFKLNSCYLEAQNKAKRVNKAKWAFKEKEFIERIISEPVPSCDEYEAYFKQKPQIPGYL